LTFSWILHASFSTIKRLSLEVSITSALAFHVILSVSAGDIVALRPQRDSKEAMIHRGLALSGLRLAFAEREKGRQEMDKCIAAATLLIGSEVCPGHNQECAGH
jgi:hypothetical protein